MTDDRPSPEEVRRVHEVVTGCSPEKPCTDCRYKHAIHPLVWRMLRPYEQEQFVGPVTLILRLAFWSAVGELPFDVDAVIAQRADYLDSPERAAERDRLVGTCEWIRYRTPAAPVWLLPGEVWFDPSQWFTGLAAS